MEDAIKDGLSERKDISGKEGPEFKRDNPGQMPTRGKGETASRDGKTFKIK